MFQIHFAPSPMATRRFALAKPNSFAARQTRPPNGDGSGSASRDAALSIAADTRTEPAFRCGSPVLLSRPSAVWNVATLASRVFAGPPSPPRPAPRRWLGSTGTPAPSRQQ